MTKQRQHHGRECATSTLQYAPFGGASGKSLPHVSLSWKKPPSYGVDAVWHDQIHMGIVCHATPPPPPCAPGPSISTDTSAMFSSLTITVMPSSGLVSRSLSSLRSAFCTAGGSPWGTSTHVVSAAAHYIYKCTMHRCRKSPAMGVSWTNIAVQFLHHSKHCRAAVAV